MKDDVPPNVYLSFLQTRDFASGMTFEVRTALTPMAFAGAVQRVVAGNDERVLVAEMRTQEEQIRETLGTERCLRAW